MSNWRPLATAMTKKLVATGELTDPAWHRAFLDTPRHIFVPDHNLADAYSQDALVTQWRAAHKRGNQRPTSSASASDAVAVMLERLAVRDHHRVLEIGTGTGYNAALLCHRLGSRSPGSATSPHWSLPMATPVCPKAHPTIASWPPTRSPTFHPNEYDNSPMAAVSSPPSSATPNPSSFWTRQRQTR